MAVKIEKQKKIVGWVIVGNGIKTFLSLTMPDKAISCMYRAPKSSAGYVNVLCTWITMKPIELAEKYMECFYGKASLSTMAALLADDLVFNGPLYNFTSAEEYLQALKSDPPEDTDYHIIKAFEKDDDVCLVYRFTKPGIETTMAQIFQIKDGKINNIELIFDPKPFTPQV